MSLIDKLKNISRRPRLLLVAVILLAVGLAAKYALHPRDPVYQGLTVSEWFERLLTSTEPGVESGYMNERKRAEQSFQHLGTEAVPFLVTQLRRHDSQLKKRCIELLVRLPMSRNVRFILLDSSNANARRRAGAARILWLIGPAAKASLPALAEACKDEDENASEISARAVGKVADPEIAVPILIQCLGDSRGGPVCSAAFCLFDIDMKRKEAASAAIPALRAALQNPNERAWFEVARALSQIDPEHSVELILPQLLKGLRENPDFPLPHAESLRGRQLLTLEMLGNFGEKSKAAMPDLLKLRSDKDELVRKCAIRAIEKIDPESAATSRLK